MQLNGWNVRLDPWSVEYGSETPGASTAEEERAEQVDISAEVSQWHEVSPLQSPLKTPLLFVDGVRRTEARLVVTRGFRVVHGAIGSYGVGSVRAHDGRAEYSEYRI